MSNTKQSTTEKARLQGLWRAAAQRGEPLVLQVKDLSTARNVRFALYNAVRGERQAPGMADELLQQALDSVQVSVQADPPAVVLSRKAILQLTEGLLDAIPGLAELSKTSETMQADASLQRVQQRIAEAAKAEATASPGLADGFRSPGQAANPFFTRDPAVPGGSK